MQRTYEQNQLRPTDDYPDLPALAGHPGVHETRPGHIVQDLEVRGEASGDRIVTIIDNLTPKLTPEDEKPLPGYTRYEVEVERGAGRWGKLPRKDR